MKTALIKARSTPQEKAALRKAAKAAKITVSALIRLCTTTPHHIGRKPAELRAALGK